MRSLRQRKLVRIPIPAARVGFICRTFSKIILSLSFPTLLRSLAHREWIIFLTKLDPINLLFTGLRVFSVRRFNSCQYADIRVDGRPLWLCRSRSRLESHTRNEWRWSWKRREWRRLTVDSIIFIVHEFHL